jgi:hypothetical protein
MYIYMYTTTVTRCDLDPRVGNLSPEGVFAARHHLCQQILFGKHYKCSKKRSHRLYVQCKTQKCDSRSKCDYNAIVRWSMRWSDSPKSDGAGDFVCDLTLLQNYSYFSLSQMSPKIGRRHLTPPNGLS